MERIVSQDGHSGGQNRRRRAGEAVVAQTTREAAAIAQKPRKRPEWASGLFRELVWLLAWFFIALWIVHLGHEFGLYRPKL